MTNYTHKIERRDGYIVLLKLHSVTTVGTWKYTDGAGRDVVLPDHLNNELVTKVQAPFEASAWTNTEDKLTYIYTDGSFWGPQGARVDLNKHFTTPGLMDPRFRENAEQFREQLRGIMDDVTEVTFQWDDGQIQVSAWDGEDTYTESHTDIDMALEEVALKVDAVHGVNR